MSNKTSGWSHDDRHQKDHRANRAANQGRDETARKMYEDTTPAPVKPAPRPSVRPDASILLQHQRNRAASGQGSGSARGSILSDALRLYGLSSGGRAIRTLQAFNGPRNERTILGR